MSKNKSRKWLSTLIICAAVLILFGIATAVTSKVDITNGMTYEEATDIAERYAEYGETEDEAIAESLMADYDVSDVEELNNTATVVLGKEDSTPVFSSMWSLLPPIIAIVLALITKEVYSSLFIGIICGAFLSGGFNLEKTYNFIVNDGLIGSLADSWNVGILVFLVTLGTIVILINKAGGSYAYGQWATKKIKTRVGAMIATAFLGIVIFVDDYFNCLTVGSVMRPITDKKNVSRAKLAYLIDATAAPVCMIAPISSWAAAVVGTASSTGYNGLELFVKAIPYNFYSILTLLMLFIIAIFKIDFGPMKRHEENALKGDIYTTPERPYGDEKEETVSSKGKVIDLIFPIVLLIVLCVAGMIYTGGFFAGTGFIESFANSDASLGLSMGSILALIIIMIYFLIRRSFKFKECMGAIPTGFKSMVPAILILTFAWTLCYMTKTGLGAQYFVGNLIAGSAVGLQYMLPAIIFAVAVGLSFATGTSWGTFGILLPIVVASGFEGPLLIMSVSACLAGAVCGDHCSPISDTTIMASTGAQCDHINHVSTQLPYALLVAAVSFVSYIVAGFTQNVVVSLAISIILLVVVLFIIKKATSIDKSDKKC